MNRPCFTLQLFIIVENHGRNQGALGLDNFEWLKPSLRDPNNPDAATERETCIE